MDVDGKYYSLWYGQFSSSASIGAGTRGETETMLYFRKMVRFAVFCLFLV